MCSSSHKTAFYFLVLCHWLSIDIQEGENGCKYEVSGAGTMVNRIERAGRSSWQRLLTIAKVWAARLAEALDECNS